MPPIIQIQNLSKEYSRRTAQPYVSLRDTITSSAKNILQGKSKKQEKFLALDNISLDIAEGDRIGIIGSNGAGKSTLLKILSRITPPTKGKVTMHGRVGSLLEVGTGFHPELSGRENIYLNGSILGLKKAEINRKLDDIIAFSGVEKFIDTPMKHFSSGMQLRLAFAVAAHLEPEILLIDEVLAVGDLAFQQKCINKMQEISQENGRTILFVSHNLKAVSDLCNKAVLLEDGKIKESGPVDQVFKTYLHGIRNVNDNRKVLVSDSPVYIEQAWCVDENNDNRYTFMGNETINVNINVKNTSWTKDVQIGLGLNFEMKGRLLIDFFNVPPIRISSTGQYTVTLPANELTPGSYTIDLSLLDGSQSTLDLQPNIASFEIALANSKFEGLGYDYGIISKKLDWKILLADPLPLREGEDMGKL